MNILLIFAFALVFPVVHIFNGWAFKFAEITPHIGLVYLPAFLRLSNILILGPLSGTLATLLGGMLLMEYFGQDSLAMFLDSACSAAGPLLALYLFRWHSGRQVELTSLRDLTLLTLLYAVANAALHHGVWSLFDPARLKASDQVTWMILGDILGALLGASILRWCVLRYRQHQFEKDLL
jgi:uncharacterized membrane protein HdeD (DUF308 family)